jgi:hypothetical protein
VATHVAVRLYWRDHGWDGTVCRDPEGNVWWERHDHIRDYKDPAEEASEAGTRFATATAKPPCGASAQALARSANRIVFHPPDWMAGMGVQPVEWGLHSATARWSTRRSAIPRPALCLREGLGRAADGVVHVDCYAPRAEVQRRAREKQTRRANWTPSRRLSRGWGRGSRRSTRCRRRGIACWAPTVGLRRSCWT